MPEPDAATPWWQSFFDDTYAQFGLTSTEPARLEATVDFLVDRLELSKGRHVFDQCCGIGRLSLPLARRGVAVTGVDLVEPYLVRAREAAAAESLPCTFVAGDAMDYVPPHACDAAFNWFTSFGYCLDDTDNARMLQRVFDALRPGGRFALDYKNVVHVLREFQPCYVERTTLPDGGETMVIVETSADFERGMFDSTWTFIGPDGTQDVREVSTRMLLPHELVRLLESVGFEDLELFGSVNSDPFDFRSRRLIITAARP